jgi:hypothetical protein
MLLLVRGGVQADARSRLVRRPYRVTLSDRRFVWVSRTSIESAGFLPEPAQYRYSESFTASEGSEKNICVEAAG